MVTNLCHSQAAFAFTFCTMNVNKSTFQIVSVRHFCHMLCHGFSRKIVTFSLLKRTIASLKMKQHLGGPKLFKTVHAPSGNRTQGSTMATLNFTTKPMVPECLLQTWGILHIKLHKFLDSSILFVHIDLLTENI